MYQPPKYSKNDPEFIYNFIKSHPFATMISKGEDLIATHVPVLLEGSPSEFRLYSHIANHNRQLSTLGNQSEVLLIFQGAHAYVSSSWYKEKDISTWDYCAVHVNAKIKIQTAEELEHSLKQLVKRFEEHQESPLYYEDIPSHIIEDHFPLITGFWATPYKVEAIAKLHQGTGRDNIERTVSHLKRGNEQEQQVAAAITKETRQE